MFAVCRSPASAWFEETHLAIARAAGYGKWFDAAAADLAKIKIGDREGHNHYSNNPRGTVVTPAGVLAQVDRYDRYDPRGHLYGAIIASVRDYLAVRAKGAYAEPYLSFAAHYIGDLSQPLHNMAYDAYNRRNHLETDGAVNDDVLDRVARIRIYPIRIRSEADLAREIARIANRSMALGYRLEREDRLPTKEEAYRQLSHSASLLKAVLNYVRETAGAAPRREPPPERHSPGARAPVFFVGGSRGSVVR